MNDLVSRYLQTFKGRKIIAASMVSPIKLCRPIYQNGQVYHRINGELLNEEQVANWKQEQQKLARKEAMEKFGLTEEDMAISEDNLKKIQQEEIRNVGLVGDDGSLKNAIFDALPKIRNCWPG